MVRFVFNYLAVITRVLETADNKHTGSIIFPFFLLASKTDKPLGDDTLVSEPVCKTHLLIGLFLHYHTVLQLRFSILLLS